MNSIEKESVSIPDKIMSILMQLFEFVEYEIENTDILDDSQDIVDQINTVFKVFNDKFTSIHVLVTSTDKDTALDNLQSSEPAFWMYKAYSTIKLMDNQKIKKLSDADFYNSLIGSILKLWEFMTKYCYPNCLVEEDRQIEIK